MTIMCFPNRTKLLVGIYRKTASPNKTVDTPGVTVQSDNHQKDAMNIYSTCATKGVFTSFTMLDEHLRLRLCCSFTNVFQLDPFKKRC